MEQSLAANSEQVRQELLHQVFIAGVPVIVVDAPPGSGKTTLLEFLVAYGHDRGLRVVVVTPRAEQCFDFVRRMLQDYPAVPIELLLARDRIMPPDLATHPNRILPNNKWHANNRERVEVATIAKLRSFVAGLPTDTPTYDLLLVDEAYSSNWASLAPLSHLAKQIVLIGDTGQLSPFVVVDTAPFEAAPYRVHWPAPRELLRRFPDIPRLQLPLTYRLPQDTTNIIGPCFYPDLPFQSVPDDRHVHYERPGAGDTIDAVLDLLAAGKTITGLLLRTRQFPAPLVDEEVAMTMALIVDRLLKRGVTWTNHRQLGPNDLGCVDPHVASGALLRTRLRQMGYATNEILCDTSEVYQGLTRSIMCIAHPLSGRVRLDPWVLEPGRFCVALSRHLLSCIVVGRDGIGEALASHHHDCAERPINADDAEWVGWQTHWRLWTELERRGRLLRL